MHRLYVFPGGRTIYAPSAGTSAEQMEKSKDIFVEWRRDGGHLSFREPLEVIVIAVPISTEATSSGQAAA